MKKIKLLVTLIILFFNFGFIRSQEISNSITYSPAISLGNKQATLFSKFNYSRRFNESVGLSFEMGYLAAYYQPRKYNEVSRHLESIQTYSICPELRLFNKKQNFNFYLNIGPSLIRWHRMNIILLTSSIVDFIDPPVWYLIGYKAELGTEFKLVKSLFLTANVSFYNYIHKDENYGMTQRVLINFGTGISYKF